MQHCWICHIETTEADIRVLKTDQGEIAVHAGCLSEFGMVAREALKLSGQATPALGLERIVREVDGKIVLIHRKFPSEQVPILVYLARFDRPVPVLEVYEWLRRNELKIKNPSLALLRLSSKGLATTLKQDETRFAMITDSGRKMLDEFADSLDQS